MSEMASESLLNFVGKYTKNDREVAVCQRRGYRMESWTYARIIGQANRVARELEVRGLGKGDAALLWGPNSAEWIVAFLGCVLRGVVIVPIDDGSALQFAERVAREVKAKFVFRANAHQEMDALPSLSFESLGEMTAKHDASFYPSPQLSRQDTLEVIFTSGTTAEPRGVVISHGNILANIERLELEIHESLQREGERCEERDGRLETFRRNFAQAEKQHFLLRWWRFRRIHRHFGWKFWAFISGGAALPEQDETFWNRLGYAVIQGYGMTETASLISLNHPFRSARGSIGKVFPGMEVRVDDNGEILVRGEGVAKAYQHNGQVQSLAGPDGWFRTGDVAEKDENGRLYFKGRRKNVIVTPAGMNVYAEDLEKALQRQPGVRDCVVIGLERGGNAEPYAVLVMSGPGANAASAVERANQTLAEYQNIRRWSVSPE